METNVTSAQRNLPKLLAELDTTGPVTIVHRDRGAIAQLVPLRDEAGEFLTLEQAAGVLRPFLALDQEKAQHGEAYLDAEVYRLLRSTRGKA